MDKKRTFHSFFVGKLRKALAKIAILRYHSSSEGYKRRYPMEQTKHLALVTGGSRGIGMAALKSASERAIGANILFKDE